MDLHLKSLKPRKIGAVNWIGLLTLVKREVDRFTSVYVQTILAPVVTTLLYCVVFALAFGGIAREVNGIAFLKFLAPGLIMMTMVQNAFANASSSMVIAKYQGSIVDVFAALGNLMLGALGLAGGIWADKFDHISAVTNFVVTPLTFLSGTFYSMSSLPEMWQSIATYNPFFYMIDGFRYGFIGQGGSDVAIGIGVLVAVNVVLVGLILMMLRTGYKIKS